MKYFGKQAEIELKDDWENLKYITKHKAYIYGPMKQMGLSTGQALKHDLSKFSPGEWGPYSKFFHGKTGIKGTNAPETRAAFREAVESHHYTHNPHHRQHAKKMPFKYQIEEVADWYAAGKAQSSDPGSFPDFKTWYLSRRKHFMNHPTKPVSTKADAYIRTKL
jgi:hypothetical protein